MSEPFIGEIRIFPYPFAPAGWAFCNGQVVPITQNTALFAIVGTTYGGDGRTTFGLPNLKGRAPMHAGRGPGLTDRRLGELTGTEAESLTAAHVPAHSHLMRCNAGDANSQTPAGNYLAREVGPATMYASAAADASMAPGAIGESGDSQEHNNMQPYLTLHFCIALTGVFPQR